MSLRLLRLWADNNFAAAAEIFDDDEDDDDDDSVGDDGVRLITEQRTTGSGDGDRDTGFGCFVFKLIVSSAGNGSFSFISFDDDDGDDEDDCSLCDSVLSALFARFGYDLRWAWVKTCPIAPYGMPPPNMDEMKRAGRSGSVDCFSAERLNDASSDAVQLDRSVESVCRFWCSPNMSRSAQKKKETEKKQKKWINFIGKHKITRKENQRNKSNWDFVSSNNEHQQKLRTIEWNLHINKNPEKRKF